MVAWRSRRRPRSRRPRRRRSSRRRLYLSRRRRKSPPSPGRHRPLSRPHLRQGQGASSRPIRVIPMSLGCPRHRRSPQRFRRLRRLSYVDQPCTAPALLLSVVCDEQDRRRRFRRCDARAGPPGPAVDPALPRRKSRQRLLLHRRHRVPAARAVDRQPAHQGAARCRARRAQPQGPAQLLLAALRAARRADRRLLRPPRRSHIRPRAPAAAHGSRAGLMASPAPDKKSATLTAEGSMLSTAKHLWVYMWPPGRPDLTLRVILAIGALMVSKVATTLVPFAYKGIIDGLGKAAQGNEALVMGIAVPVVLVVAYGIGNG